MVKDDSKRVLRILIDNREQAPFRFEGYECECVRGTLNVADYSTPGLQDKIGIERKSLPDLIGSITSGRERFEAEIRRARHLDRFLIVIEAAWSDLKSGNYRSGMNPHAAAQTIISWQVKYDVAFIFAGSRAGAEYVTYWTIQKYVRNLEEAFKQTMTQFKEKGRA